MDDTQKGVFIDRQITVFKNATKLLEFQDKLQPAPYQYYAHIHASHDTDLEDAYRRISCIGLLAKDYSKGTGDLAVNATANISPAEADRLYRKALVMPKAYEFKTQKKFDSPKTKATYAKPLGGGELLGTNLIITRREVDDKGQRLNNPWTVTIENFLLNRTRKAVSVFMTDDAFADRLYAVTHYITMWEVMQGSRLFKESQRAIQAQRLSEYPTG